eukprot:TRINITY_DN4559_c0_g1_i1.p1 TRINITY_DN4559_c0_g1~~TRINITY_DN4559_c0_g1_i1.p1  ORF type:complete len:386 (+),score=61.75 TRINITY_DN4559_c0_g1_i1:91-1248(+)
MAASGRSSAQSRASSDAVPTLFGSEQLSNHAKAIIYNADGTLNTLAIVLILIQAHALRETNIRDVFIIWDGISASIRDVLRRAFLSLPQNGVILRFPLANGQVRNFELGFTSYKSSKQACNMREYVTRQTRDSVHQFANFLTCHSHEDPIFSHVQSLLVSNELLSVVLDLEAMQSKPDQLIFFERQLEHLVKRIGGSAVPISRLYSTHPRPHQQRVRAAMIAGLSTLGYGLIDGTYKPKRLDTAELAAAADGTSFMSRITKIQVIAAQGSFLTPKTAWPPDARAHGTAMPATKRSKSSGQTDMEAAQWLLQLQSTQQQQLQSTQQQQQLQSTQQQLQSTQQQLQSTQQQLQQRHQQLQAATYGSLPLPCSNQQSLPTDAFSSLQP